MTYVLIEDIHEVNVILKMRAGCQYDLINMRSFKNMYDLFLFVDMALLQKCYTDSVIPCSKLQHTAYNTGKLHAAL